MLNFFGSGSAASGGEDYENETTMLITPNLSEYKEEEGERLFTRRNTPSLVAFFVFVFSSGAFMSIITPFLPLELEKCGAENWLVGLVFSAYPCANLVAVPISTRLSGRRGLGRSKAFALGASLEALFGIAFGYAHVFAPVKWLKWLYLCIRFAQGLGSSIAYTALMGWVSDKFLTRLAVVLGFQEAVGGVGLMLGPALGGLLYGLGGVALPLLAFSCLVLASLPPLVWSMATEKLEAAPSADDDNDGASTLSEILTVSELINASTVNSTAVTLIAAIGFGFIAPIAAPHFEDVLSAQIRPGEVGLLLAIPALLYAVLSPVSGVLAESKYGYKATMFTGILLLLVGFLLLGPLKIFGLENYSKGMWIDQILALILFGIGAAFAFVPALPDMQRSVLHLGPEATNAMAGFFNGMYCLGEATGPLLAGLRDVLSLPFVCFIISLVHLVYILVALYWYMSVKLCQSALRKARSHSSLVDADDPHTAPLLYR